jgi:phosphatidylglycerol---prolipoprotein diacylglyceryl transferase
MIEHMRFAGPFVHDIDPIIGTILGVHLWWYGLSYTLGFLNAHRFVMRRRLLFGLSRRDVFEFSLLLSCGVLVGGRIVEIAFYEWPFYAKNIDLVGAFWLGGMASHGLLAGGLAAVWIFSRRKGLPFLQVTDLLSIPAAFILGAGRIGNFIDGQILGSVTAVPWAVKFPDAEGFRHPVVLYDGIKNLLIIPILWMVGRANVPSGVVTGIFLALYAGLRIPVDNFREYPTSLLGLATGQALNISMALLGLAYAAWRLRASGEVVHETVDPIPETVEDVSLRKALFAAVLLFCLTIPSDWTQDIPARYGHRHPGLAYSTLYPAIDTDPK